MIQTFHIEGRLPGLNEIIAAARSGGGRWSKYGDMKKKWSRDIALQIMAQHVKPVIAAKFRFHWTEKTRRRDPDNIIVGKKFIFDGLVCAKILSNDGWDQILSISDTWETGPDGVTVTLERRE